MDMMKMIKEAAAMRSKLGEMEKTLKGKIVEVDTNGVKIRMNAKSELLEVKLSPDVLQQDVARLEKNIQFAFQSALKQSQDIMAEEAKKITGGLKIPGLM
jgi:DNA-binding protein YbaB